MQKAKTYRFGFVGLGRMAQILLRNMLERGLAQPHEVIVSRRSGAVLKKITRDFGVATSQDNRAVATHADMLWLGVKPYQARDLCREISPCLKKTSIVFSIMAGISTVFLKAHLGPKIKVIRLMPNTPALVGAGMTGVFFSGSLSPALRRQVLKILESFGETLVVAKEKHLDAVTGLSGSGPAFIYYLVKALTEGGVRSGLSQNASSRLACQTAWGALRMLKEGRCSPETLLQQVVTPGGTTEAGLKVLEKKKVAPALQQAVLAAAQRAAHMREENDRCIC